MEKSRRHCGKQWRLFYQLGFVVILVVIPSLTAQDLALSDYKLPPAIVPATKRAAVFLEKMLKFAEDAEKKHGGRDFLRPAAARSLRQRDLEKKAGFASNNSQRDVVRRGQLHKNNKAVFWRCFFNAVSCFRK